MEQKIIAALIRSRQAWEQSQDLLDPRDFSLEGQKLLEILKQIYTRDTESAGADIDLVAMAALRATPSDKAARVIENFLKGLPSGTAAGDANILAELRLHKLHIVGQQLGSALVDGRDEARIDELLDSYTGLKSGTSSFIEEEETFQGASLASLVSKSFSKEGLIELWPAALNAKLDGGVRPGHHVLVFAPTEMGKTLFAINMVAGFLKQGKKVLYVGNEDPAADILMRLASRISGRNKHEIIRDPEGTDRVLASRNWGLFTLVSLAPGTFSRINSLVCFHKPDVVILDQLRNIDVKSDNRVVGLERAATEARNLGKRRKVLVVSISQAGDSASGKRVLDRGDVDFSNVGIPGQCDLMIGLGADANMERSNLRMISLPKNKISGDHDPIVITIDPTISKVVEDVK